MKDQNLDYIFHPRSIAVAGASADPMKQGYVYVQLLKTFGFGGEIYPINAKVEELLGLKTYPSLGDVPGTVDYVISCLPAALVPTLMEECVAKGVKVVHLYTGRLAETGESEKADREKEILRIARRGNIRVIGPNCMGLYCPEEGLSFKFNFPREKGVVGFFSQSGGNSFDLVYRSSIRGIRFSKVVSYGNASDLNEADLLEYFLGDPETQIIAGYIEGVREGSRFFKLLREAKGVKPVIIHKGGRTAAGERAVASHTASLAGSEAIWEALCRQTGAIRVYSIAEMIDIILSFLFLSPPKSRRTAVLGGGGGRSVQASDDCELAGLVLPPLPREIRQEIMKVAPEIGGMIKNPMDMSVIQNQEVFSKTMRIVAGQPTFDLLIGVASDYWSLDRPAGCDYLHAEIGEFIEIGKTFEKPMAVVLSAADSPEDWRWRALIEEQERCYQAGFPVYPNIGSAARALNKLLRYHEELDHE